MYLVFVWHIWGFGALFIHSWPGFESLFGQFCLTDVATLPLWHAQVKEKQREE